LRVAQEVRSVAQEVTSKVRALTQLGKPYLWGGAGPAEYDCSGLTMMAWARAGVQLLHYTGYQWEEGPHVRIDSMYAPGGLIGAVRPAG